MHADSLLTLPLLSMPKLLIFGHMLTHQNLSGNTVWKWYENAFWFVYADDLKWYMA